MSQVGLLGDYKGISPVDASHYVSIPASHVAAAAFATPAGQQATGGALVAGLQTTGDVLMLAGYRQRAAYITEDIPVS